MAFHTGCYVNTSQLTETLKASVEMKLSQKKRKHVQIEKVCTAN